MTEILVLRGLPASGKTTHAKSIADTHSSVSRDSIRTSLTGRTDKFVGDRDFETKVSKIQEGLVRTYIKNGRSVVVDDTNLRLRYATRWIELANSLGVESDVLNFKVPLPELLQRNSKRLDRVPDQLIRDLYVRFPHKDWPPVLLPTLKQHLGQQYEAKPGLPPCVTVDLDGTLALHTSGRSPYDTSRYHEDTLNESLAEVLTYLAPHVRVGVFTGRSEDYRQVCEDWLEDNGVAYDFLLMRSSGDTRQDALIKKEIFTEHIAPKYKHLGHWDDRNRVVEGLRSIGVQVWQAAGGDF